MLEPLFPGRAADRLILRVTDLLDTFDGPSAFANGVIIDFLELIESDEELTSAAKDAMHYAMLAGYAVRLVEEADGTARAFDEPLLARLAQVRSDAPRQREQEFEEAIADPGATEAERDYLRHLQETGKDIPYDGEREVLDALIADDTDEGWFGGERFRWLSGFGENVWQIFVLKLTTVVNQQVAGEEMEFPWEAVRDAVRFGYVLRGGDALNGYVPYVVEV